MNLISNAVKFTSKGNIKVVLTYKEGDGMEFGDSDEERFQNLRKRKKCRFTPSTGINALKSTYTHGLELIFDLDKESQN